MIIFNDDACDLMAKYDISNASQLYTPDALRNRELDRLRSHWLSRLEPVERARAIRMLK